MTATEGHKEQLEERLQHDAPPTSEVLRCPFAGNEFCLKRLLIVRLAIETNGIPLPNRSCNSEITLRVNATRSQLSGNADIDRWSVSAERNPSITWRRIKLSLSVVNKERCSGIWV